MMKYEQASAYVPHSTGKREIERKTDRENKSISAVVSNLTERELQREIEDETARLQRGEERLTEAIEIGQLQKATK